MKAPDGFFNAGDKANQNGVIESWVCDGDLTITKLWIPNTIRSIGNRAFCGCGNLETVVFEDGGSIPLSIGLMAFAQCVALKAISLPARTVSIGKGCFRDCYNLEDVEIGQGEGELRNGDHVFDNCSGQVVMQKTLADEVDRRSKLRPKSVKNARTYGNSKTNKLLEALRSVTPNCSAKRDDLSAGLQAVYDVIVNSEDFNMKGYAQSYEMACTHFQSIDNWLVASEEELRKVMVGKFIKNVASINFGEILDREFDVANKDELRKVCAFIANLSGSIDEDAGVFEMEEHFVAQFTKRHPAAFYRIVAALRPDFVVPVPAIAKLAPVYAWLHDISFESALQFTWYTLSRAVRGELQSCLPEKTKYQVGVFAWYLAEAFRDDLGDRADALLRKSKVLAALKDVRLL